MVSQMAKEDVIALQQKGVSLSFDEIVKLNGLGVKAENSPDSWTFYAIPRCVFLSDEMVLREPTLGHEIWFDSVSRQFDIDDEVTLFSLRAYMMSRDLDELPKWYHISQVKNELEKFIKKELRPFTIRQIMNAVAYCIDGNDPDSHFRPPEKHDENETAETDENASPSLGIIRHAQALNIAIPMKDMKEMTESDIQNII